MDPTVPSEAATQRVLELLAGKWVVSAMCTAVSLGLIDRVAEHPQSRRELAEHLDCHEPSLHRLLEVLVAEGILIESRDNQFLLSELGHTLRRDQLGALARFIGSSSQWSPWAELEHSVRTGRAAFERTHGEKLFDYLARRPEEARVYDEAVDVFTRHEAQALVSAYDFAPRQQVVDVGGGRGTLLVEVLRRWPHLRGVLVDLDSVVEAARGRLEHEFGPRCEVVAADFRESVPTGADAYVIKRVLHNWDDDQALRILEVCAQAMSPSGHVLVVEGVLLPNTHRDVTRLLDLEMLVLTDGGRERRKPEFRRLFRRAGLRLLGSRPLSGSTRLMVAARS